MEEEQTDLSEDVSRSEESRSEESRSEMEQRRKRRNRKPHGRWLLKYTKGRKGDSPIKSESSTEVNISTGQDQEVTGQATEDTPIDGCGGKDLTSYSFKTNSTTENQASGSSPSSTEDKTIHTKEHTQIDVPIMTVFQNGIVESMSLVEHMSSEEQEAALTALKDMLDGSSLWKKQSAASLPPTPPSSKPPAPRPRGRPKGKKKQTIEYVTKTQEFTGSDDNSSSGTTNDVVAMETSESTVTEFPQCGSRRSSRRVKPTYKVKDSSSVEVSKKKDSSQRSAASGDTLGQCKVEDQSILHNVEDAVAEKSSPSESDEAGSPADVSDQEVEVTGVRLKVKETIKVEDKEAKDSKTRDIRSKQWKLQKDVKRFLQKTGQLKSRKKTMMSEVKGRADVDVKPVHRPEVTARMPELKTEEAQVRSPEKSVTSTERQSRGLVELGVSENIIKPDMVSVKGYRLVKQDEDGGWRCETCGKVSLYRAAGICHLRTHTKDRPFTCPQCNKSFSFEPNKLRHMSTAHNINTILCRMCDAGFGRKQDLLKHCEETHGLTSAQVNNYCKICDKHFNQRSSYKSHLRYKHSNQKAVFICQFCPKRFNFQSNLIRHVKIHTGDKPHKCAYCDAAFIERKSLTLHQMKSHDTPEVRAMLDVTQKYNCRICDKEFMNKGNLIVHQRVHTREKPFPCLLCPKAFSIKSNLKRHEATHRGERPFQCPDCMKRFTEKRSMEIHRRLHTGEKPYQCDVCLKRFAQLGTLTSHRPVHSKERHFKCVHCAATFLRSSHLSTHLRKHTLKESHGGRDDASLVCQQCGERFNDRNDLLQHEVSHSLVAEPSLNCPLCPDKFPTPERLNRHLYSHMGLGHYQCTLCEEKFDCNKAASRHLSEVHAEEYKYNHMHEDGKEMIKYIEPALPLTEADKVTDHTTRMIVTNPTETVADAPPTHAIPPENQLAAEGMVSLAGTASRIYVGGESVESNSPQLISQAIYEQLLAQATPEINSYGMGTTHRASRTVEEGGVSEMSEDGRQVIPLAAEGGIKLEGDPSQLTGTVLPGETVFRVQGQNGEVFLITSQ